MICDEIKIIITILLPTEEVLCNLSDNRRIWEMIYRGLRSDEPYYVQFYPIYT